MRWLAGNAIFLRTRNAPVDGSVVKVLTENPLMLLWKATFFMSDELTNSLMSFGYAPVFRLIASIFPTIDSIVLTSDTSLIMSVGSKSFPKDLSELVSSSDVKNVAYHNNINGFSVNTFTTDPSTGALRVRKKIAFPTSQRIAPRTLAMYRDQLKQAREGKLDVLHPEPKKVPAGGPRAYRPTTP